MSYYKIIDIIDAGHHSFTVENEDGVAFARAEGPDFATALARLREAVAPTRRPEWLSPFDESEAEYAPRFYECGCCGAMHSVSFGGDCRENAARLDIEDLNREYGPHGWIEVDFEEYFGLKDAEATSN